MTLRFSDLLKLDLINDLDIYYDKYQTFLPPFEDLTYMTMDDVPEFLQPNTWVLKQCLHLLLNQERCDPNIHDNYGETLLNFAIKENK